MPPLHVQVHSMAHLYSGLGHLCRICIHVGRVLVLAGAHFAAGATDTQSLAGPSASCRPTGSLAVALTARGCLAGVSPDVPGAPTADSPLCTNTSQHEQLRG